MREGDAGRQHGFGWPQSSAFRAQTHPQHPRGAASRCKCCRNRLRPDPAWRLVPALRLRSARHPLGAKLGYEDREDLGSRSACRLLAGLLKHCFGTWARRGGKG